MSADNGIYILETKETVGLRYRVAHCQAIDDIHFVPPGRYCPKGQRFVNLPALWRRFKDSEVFRTDISAYAEARKKEAQETICEYGISHIELDRPFPEFSEVLAFAIQEVDDCLGWVCNDDQPVKGKVLYNARFSIVQALRLISEQFGRLDLAVLDVKHE